VPGEAAVREENEMTDESLMAGFANEPLEAALPRWRKGVDKVLNGADFDKKLVSATLEGIAVQPLYTALDWANAQDAAGFAGVAPYRRGTLAVGRAGARWDLRARLEHPDPTVLSAEIAAEQARGVRSFWLRLDREARTGRGAQGMAMGMGAPCWSAAHIGELLQAALLQRTGLSVEAGGNGLAVMACIAAALRAQKNDVALAQLELQADPLGALARDGALPGSLDTAAQQLGALGAWASERAPKLRVACVSTAPYHDAGAHAAQELGYALATGATYLRWLTEAGLTVSQAARQISFSVPVGSDLFMEVAKLRALRQCWAQLVAASGGDAEDQRAVLHAFSSDRTKSQRDPWVNMLRETTEAFAAAVGGADAITTAGFDRAVGPSDDFARRIASNVQVILDEEAHVAQVADAAGGSYYVETLTDELAARGWALLQSIEAEGGMATLVSDGRIAKQVAETAAQRAASIAKRKQAITGVSEFAHVAEAPLERAQPDAAAIARARADALSAQAEPAALAAVMAARASGVASRAQAVALVEAAIEAASKGASLAQLTQGLCGTDPAAQIEPLVVRRDAVAFEALRDAADAQAKKSGARPSVFLANLGPIPQHKARSQFATNFFAAGGFIALDNDGFDTPDAALTGFRAALAQTRIAILCGSDDAYATWVEALAPQLKAAGATRIVLAGKPAAEAEAAYRAAGVTDFIFMGADVVKTLATFAAAVSS
jgi:methylmalonyl-CoA mutase